MSHNRIKLLNAHIDCLTMAETINIIEKNILESRQIQHVVVNVGKLVAMQKDRRLADSVNGSDLINADGQGIVWASRLLGCPLPERVAGIDLMQNLVKLAYEKGYRCFFLGANEEVVAKVVEIYSNVYSPNIIAGYRNGYFTSEEEESVAKQISESNADLLFVAISSPKKEIFMNKFKKTINVPFIMGVGGSFDVIAGKTKRAPLWMQNIGMEWFFRLIQEPRRMWKRYIIGNIRFVIFVLKEKFRLSNSGF